MNIDKLIKYQVENRDAILQAEIEKKMAEEQHKEMCEFTPQVRRRWPQPIRRR